MVLLYILIAPWEMLGSSGINDLPALRVPSMIATVVTDRSNNIPTLIIFSPCEMF